MFELDGRINMAKEMGRAQKRLPLHGVTYVAQEVPSVHHHNAVMPWPS